jgi:hypothetical protein
MAIATITSVNLPEHQYPHVEVKINDNTLRRYTQTGTEYGKTLSVFRSPKGPDGIYKVTGRDQFVDTYGEGSVADYGQPLLIARTLANSNIVTQYCLRVTDSDAKVANLHIFARYRVKEYTNESKDQSTSISGATVSYDIGTAQTPDVISVTGKTLTVYTSPNGRKFIDLRDTTSYVVERTIEGETVNVWPFTDSSISVGRYRIVNVSSGTPTTITITNDTIAPTTSLAPGKMSVYFVAKTDDNLKDIHAVTEKDKYASSLINKISTTGTPGAETAYSYTDITGYAPDYHEDPPQVDFDDWKEVRLMSVSALGKGIYGNTFSFIIDTDPNRDKSNAYKNYFFQIYEGSTLIEKFAITLTSAGIVRGESKYISNVVNDDDGTGEASSVIRVDFNEDALKLLYNEYNTRVNPGNISYDEFDAIRGIDKRKVNSRRYVTDKAIDGYTICTQGIDLNHNPNGVPYVDAADFTTDINSGDYYPLIQTDYKSETIDATEYYQFDAVTGTALESGNDGKFALTTAGGTATTQAEIDTAVEAAYRKVFGGSTGKRYNLYKSVTLVELDGIAYTPSTEHTAPVETYWFEDPKIYFDVNNNYLIDLHQFPNHNEEASQRYVIISKRGNTITIPSAEDRAKYNLYSTPDDATPEYPYPDLLTKNKTAIDFFLDANYSYDTKIDICNWVNTYRSEDFVVYLDAGTSDVLVSKTDGYTWVQAFDEATNGSEYKKFWYFSIDAYYGKIKDPYNYKIVEVTSTYNLARHLVAHWAANGGKHIPYAGSLYAVIDSYLPRSVFPLMDEGLDSEHMDRFIEEHVNYAQVNSRGDVIRATQSTRYPILGDAFTLSNLTELNNVHIVLDIKKDVENVLELFAYQFNEQSDLKRFNTIIASSILPKYSAAQVKSISATFDRTSEEAEYGILHLYIQVVHKNLVKIVMVDIDVNRNTD